MKKILTGIILFAISTTVGWAQQQPQVTMSWSPSPAPAANAHSVFISKHTTRQYLDSVSTAWKKDGIVLEFTELKYNAGGLKTVRGKVHYISGKHPEGSFSNSNLKKGIDIRIDEKNVSVEGE